MSDNVLLLLSYHFHFPKLSPQEFILSLNALVRKWNIIKKLPPTEPYTWETLPETNFQPKKFISEDLLHKMLMNCVFICDLTTLFSIIDVDFSNSLFDPVSLESLILKHVFVRPDMVYEQVGGNPETFLQYIDLTPTFEFYELSGCLDGEQYFIPGPCLKKFYILNQYLTVGSEGSVFIKKYTLPGYKHIEFTDDRNSSCCQMSFKWDVYIPKITVEQKVSYPHEYLPINMTTLTSWAFYYQDYQSDLYTHSKKSCTSAIHLALLDKGHNCHLDIDRVHSTELLTRGQATVKSWKIAQHMLAAYLQYKHFKYPKLHRYREFRQWEPEYFSLADEYLLKLHEDLSFYTKAPLLEHVTIMEEKVTTETKTVTEFEPVSTPTPYTQEMLDIIQKGDEPFSATLNPIELFSYDRRGIIENMKKIYGQKPGKWDEIVGEKLGKFRTKIYKENMRDMVTLVEQGHALEEFQVPKIKLAQTYLEAAAVKHFELTTKKEVADSVKRIKKDIAPILEQHSDLKIEGGNLVYLLKKEKEVKYDTTEVREISKHITQNVIPLGASLYRRVDFKNVFEKQIATKHRATPIVRYTNEAVKRSKPPRSEVFMNLWKKSCIDWGEWDRGFYHMTPAELKAELKSRNCNELQVSIRMKHIRFSRNDAIKRHGRDFESILLEHREKVMKRANETRLERFKQPEDVKKYKLISNHFRHVRKCKKKGVEFSDVHPKIKDYVQRAVIGPKSSLKIPDHVYEHFQEAKAAVVLSKLSWTSSWTDPCERKRPKHRSPKGITYTHLFLKRS
jgi:hypothetical protein